VRARPQGIGKTEAEKLIYGTTIVAWLALPVALDAVSVGTSPLTVVYALSASIILVGALASLFVRTRVATSKFASTSSAAWEERGSMVRPAEQARLGERPLPTNAQSSTR
jgi:hypothetical protein